MRIPKIKGVIRRRLLLNYRVRPEVIEALLPVHFHPKLVRGWAVAGVCLIRLEKIRPGGVPEFAGIGSENAAFRIAAEWEDDDGTPRQGVFIPRRDTDSWFNSLVGWRVFPGVHHHSRFEVTDRDGCVAVRISAREFDEPLVEVDAAETEFFPDDSVFGSLAEASEFFEAGAVGYSARPDSGWMDGLALQVADWRVRPLRVERIRSAYYDDPARFPPGSLEFDHALIMRHAVHEWHSRPMLFRERRLVAGVPAPSG